MKNFILSLFIISLATWCDRSTDSLSSQHPQKFSFTKIKIKNTSPTKLSGIIDSNTEKGSSVLAMRGGEDPDGDGVLTGDGSNPCFGVGDKECCYSDADCDDNKPETLDKCLAYKNGEPFYQCSHETDPDYCTASVNSDCDDGNPCTKDACCENGSVIGGDTSVSCSGKTNNKCVHEEIAGCCNKNKDCLLSYFKDTGKYDFFMLHICCGGDGVDIDGNSESACAGKSKNECVHVLGSGFCETAEDCKPNPVGKKCLTAYCIAHRCRYGLPKLNGCCEKNEDCDDKNVCTIDQCKNIVDGKGTCENIKDPNKPGCCTSTVPDCCDNSPTCDPQTETCCLEGCTKIVCKYNSAVGYKTCTNIDLSNFGLCCEKDSDCDDNNECTADTCDKNVCRHIKFDPACCTTDFMCPDDGDACAEKKCVNKSCELKEDVSGCIANIPYKEKFDMNKSFYNDYTKLSAISWYAVTLAGGDLNSNWQFSNSGTVLGSDKYLAFAGSGLTGNIKVCAYTPYLNTLGKLQITIGFESAVVLTGSGANLKVELLVRKDDESWDNATSVTVIDNITTSSTGAVYKTISVNETSGKLDSQKTQVAFCLSGNPGGVLNYFGIDNIVVSGGNPPVIVTNFSDMSVAAGATKTINFEAIDADGDNIKLYLEGAPSFVSIKNFNQTTDGVKKVATAQLVVENAKCSSTNSYDIRVIASDGYLKSFKTFNLTITGCQ